MALIAQLQEIWRAQLEKYLLVNPVFVDVLCNRNYEADLKNNKTVHIISIPELTGRTYSVNQYNVSPNDWVWDKASTTSQTFQAGQTFEIHPNVDPLEQYGSAIKLIDEIAVRVARALRLAQDTYISGLHTGITTNTYGTNAAPIVVGFNKAGNETLPTLALSQLQRLAASSNADVSVFKTVVPVWFAQMLNEQLGQHFTPMGDKATASGVRPGVPMEVGVGGFDAIVPSNNVAYDTTTGVNAYKVMAGNPSSSITFAEAVTVSETGKVQAGYGDYIKMLNVYGGLIPVQGQMSLGTFVEGTPLSLI
jgi:hypothetical protein